MVQVAGIWELEGPFPNRPRVEGVSREGDGTPLQYSCLENPMDTGTWQATVPGVTKESDTT